jgi:predicted nucleic acid-binding protein
MKHMSNLVRCFIDTNIWLYAFIVGQDKAKASVAQRVIEDTHAKIAISTQVVNEVCVNMLRKAGANESDVRQLIEAFYHRCEVVLADKDMLLKATDLRQQYALSYWDSLIVAAALDVGAAELYTEDMQHGQVIDGRLTIINPFQNLK